MNPIEFGADLFAKAKEMQIKTVSAFEVIARMDEELSTMPEPFKMDFMKKMRRQEEGGMRNDQRRSDSGYQR